MSSPTATTEKENADPVVLVTPGTKSEVAKKMAGSTSSATTNSSSKKKKPISSMNKAELVEELKARNELIVQLEKRLKGATVKGSGALAKPAVDPAKVKAAAEKLKALAYRGIKKQLKWKNACRTGKARWSWEGMCDEATFRQFMNLGPTGKAKGTRMTPEAFQDFMGQEIEGSARYNALVLTGKNVTISYGASGEIKICGQYGI